VLEVREPPSADPSEGPGRHLGPLRAGVISSHHLNRDRQYDGVEAVVAIPETTSVRRIVLRNKARQRGMFTPEGKSQRVETEMPLGV
jgi:hypothetical protein